MNCPECRQSYASDTFVCQGCGCKVFNGEQVAEMPPMQITTHGVLATWRFLQMMIGGIVVGGAGVGMFLVQAPLYGSFLICVAIAVFAFGFWSLKRR